MKLRFLLGPLLATAAVALLGSWSAGDAAALPPPQKRQRIKCESNGQYENFCAAQIAGNVRISRQISKTQCREGQNWRWNRNGITVWGGCRADFEFDVWTGGSGGNWSSGGWQRIKCESINNRRNFCSAIVGGDVHISRQISDTKCVQGRNWGWNRDGIWVDHGCRADFEFRERGPDEREREGERGGWHHGDNWNYDEDVTCESKNNTYHECSLGRKIDEVRLMRQLSGAACNEGGSWGLRSNRKGIWVNHGCRAVFGVRYR